MTSLIIVYCDDDVISVTRVWFRRDEIEVVGETETDDSDSSSEEDLTSDDDTEEAPRPSKMFAAKPTETKVWHD